MEGSERLPGGVAHLTLPDSPSSRASMFPTLPLYSAGEDLPTRHETDVATEIEKFATDVFALKEDWEQVLIALRNSSFDGVGEIDIQYEVETVYSCV